MRFVRLSLRVDEIHSSTEVQDSGKLSEHLLISDQVWLFKAILISHCISCPCAMNIIFVYLLNYFPKRTFTLCPIELHVRFYQGFYLTCLHHMYIHFLCEFAEFPCPCWLEGISSNLNKQTNKQTTPTANPRRSWISESLMSMMDDCKKRPNNYALFLALFVVLICVCI